MDGPYPPKSYYITTGHNGETCGSVFWIWINHRLMQLYPGGVHLRDCRRGRIRQPVLEFGSLPGQGGELPILVNGEEALRAQGGIYAGLRRSWQEGDTISFDLPFTLRAAEYTGFDQDEGNRSRWTFYCGPVLLALTGNFAETETLCLTLSPEEPEKDLIPQGNLQFTVRNNPGCRFIPYYAVQEEVFSCFPVLKAP